MKKIRKILILLALVCTLLVCCMMSASAKIYSGAFGDSNELYYEYNSETNTVVISGKGDIPDYNILYQPWRLYGKVEQVIIKEGVKSIGHSAFKNHDYLKSVSLPLSVKTIDASAFKGCLQLETINLYAVTELGENAFESCRNLKNVHFSPYLDEIPEKAFEGCWNLRKIELPSGISEIGKNAFNNCYYYSKSLTIPDSVTSIGESAFNNCSITDLVLGKRITSIPANAFSDNDLTQLVIPSNVKSIHHDENAMLDSVLEGSFSNNKNLSKIYIESNTSSNITGEFLHDGVEYLGSGAFTYWFFDDVEGEDTGRLTVALSICDVYCKANSLNHDFKEEIVHYNHEHTFPDVSTIKPYETCEKKKVTAKCTECGIKQISYLDGAAHHEKTTETIKEPTCSQEGYLRVYCSVCDYEKYEIGYSSYNHTGIYVSKSAKKPTCTQNGWSEGKSCRDCKTIVTASEVIPATNHAKKYKRNIAATCTKDGYNGSYYCPDCYSYLYDEATVIPALNHKNKVNYDLLDSTCSAKGHEAGVYCPDCKTWLEGGAEIGYKDHSYGDWYVTKPATCQNKEDTKERKCSVCGKTETTTTTSNNPRHPDDNQNGVCDLCSKDFKKTCTHFCHEKMQYGINGKGSFGYRIRVFFWKLFKTNKLCECGMKHY